MKGYRNTNIGHVNLNDLLSSHNGNSIFKQFSEGLLPLEKSQSTFDNWINKTEDNLWADETELTKSTSAKFSNKTDQNFKVIVRVRPPLPREIEISEGYSSIVQISKNNK